MCGKCTRDITHVPEMCLVETCQVNGSSPFNVPDMFLPVSRHLHPQCVRADEVTTDKHACDKVNGKSHVREAQSELNH